MSLKRWIGFFTRPLVLRKKIIFVIIFTALLIVIVGFFKTELNIHHDTRYKKTSNKYTNFTTCPVFSIHSNGRKVTGQQACTDHISTTSSCNFTAEIFKYNPEVHTCRNDPRIRICRFVRGKFKCNVKNCGRHYSDFVYIHIFNTKTGETTAFAVGSESNERLETVLARAADQTIRNGFNFLFVSCGDDVQKTQLLLLSKDMLKANKNDNKTSRNIKSTRNKIKNKININIVLIDSLSRAHFYRSLKKTVNVFKKFNLGSNVEVLDFELYQALHGHTNANTYALFTGTNAPHNLTNTQVEDMPLCVEDFYNHFQKNGYYTLHQDDMCWQSYWGIRMDLGGGENWDEFHDQMKKAHINDTGISCLIYV